MLRLLLLIAAASACALALPAGAAAHGVHGAHGAHAPVARTSVAESVADEQITAWIGAAQRHWGAGPACQDAVQAVRAQWLDDPGVWAAAMLGGCEIALDPDFYPMPADADRGWWEAAMCSVIAHEWGHLLGNGHVTDPGNLMSPTTPLNVVADCPRWPEPGDANAAAPAAPRTSSRARCARARSARRRSGRPTRRCAARRAARR